MLPKTLNEWLALGGTLIALGVTVFGCLRRTREWFKHLRESVRSHKRFVEHFEGDYPKEIHGIVTDLGSAQDLNETYSRIILRRLGLGLFIAEATGGRWLHVTDRLAEIFGITPSACLGFGWAAQVDSRAEKVAEWNWSIAHQLTYRANFTVTNAQSGKRVSCYCEAVFVGIDGGRYVGCVEVISEENPPAQISG